MRGRSAMPVFVVLLVALATALPVAHAAVKPGAACKAKDVGKTVRVGTNDLRCVKKGKIYAWSVVTAKTSAGAKPPSGAVGSGQGGGKAGSGTGGGSGQGGGSGTPSSSGQGDTSHGIASSSQIPKVIENWSLELAPYDPATGRAGAMKLAGVQPPTFPNPDDTDAYKRIVGVYGMEVHGILEPQMAFIAPLGTKVISMVDGTVCDMPTLYSKDVSIRIAPTGIACTQGGASILFEHEHVITPSVAVGSKVTAGQPIALVSDYSTHWAAKGMGIVEIGVFFSKNDNSGRPWHACPSLFLAPAKATQLLQTMSSIQQAWATVRGDASLDTVSKQSPVGCLTQADITDSNNAQTGAKG